MKALVVDDDPNWQGISQRGLERVLGAGNVDLAASYSSAVALMETNKYDAYLLDGEFPRESGNPEGLGIELAQRIKEREGSFDRIRLLSGNKRILDQAQELGIITYTKSMADEDKGYKDFMDLGADIQEMLGL